VDVQPGHFTLRSHCNALPRSAAHMGCMDKGAVTCRYQRDLLPALQRRCSNYLAPHRAPPPCALRFTVWTNGLRSRRRGACAPGAERSAVARVRRWRNAAWMGDGRWCAKAVANIKLPAAGRPSTLLTTNFRAAGLYSAVLSVLCRADGVPQASRNIRATASLARMVAQRRIQAKRDRGFPSHLPLPNPLLFVAVACASRPARADPPCGHGRPAPPGREIWRHSACAGLCCLSSVYWRLAMGFSCLGASRDLSSFIAFTPWARARGERLELKKRRGVNRHVAPP